MYQVVAVCLFFRWDAIKNAVTFKFNQVLLLTRSLKGTFVQERTVVVFHDNRRVPKLHALTFHLPSLRSQDTDLQYPRSE